jgi:hypothetical protein
MDEEDSVNDNARDGGIRLGQNRKLSAVKGRAGNDRGGDDSPVDAGRGNGSEGVDGAGDCRAGEGDNGGRMEMG